MPEVINDRQIFSLQEVGNSIQKVLSERYKSSFWVKAEMIKLNHYPKSGHCYPDLVEKVDGKVVAQFRANLWATDYLKINQKFKTVLKEPLKDGIKILFLTKINYHPEFGLSLQILDIDPEFTLGDHEREKQETIDKLISEGIFRKNKSLKIAQLPKRIAIISVVTSKGYADFIQVLQQAEKNWNYRFFYYLFPSVLQGDLAIKTIMHQLSKIEKVRQHFDVVAIIRGGGGDVGLASFNNYELAKTIALFPLPVITGIGHSTNETVSEMVAFENAITPTKLAEYLIQKFHNFSVPLNKSRDRIIDLSRRIISDEHSRFKSEIKIFRSVTENKLIKSNNNLNQQIQLIIQFTKLLLSRKKMKVYEYMKSLNKNIKTLISNLEINVQKLYLNMRKDSSTLLKNKFIELEYIQKNIINLSPQNVLKRGYSITLQEGKTIKELNTLKPGDKIVTKIFEGQINSTVQSTNKISKDE
jgi:exodeoxyribonuclease VII large subunit